MGTRGGAEEAAAELTLAWVCMETFELDAARRHLVRARTCGPQSPGALVTLVLTLVTARLSRARGDPAGARDVLGETIDRAPALPGWMQSMLHRERGTGPEGVTVPVDETAPTLASRVEELLLEAAERLAAGEAARARRVVARSLELATPETLRRPFRETPREVRQLLRLDPALLAAHAWLIGGDRGEPGGSTREPGPSVGAGASRSSPVVLVPLTGKELEVLMHLDALARTEDIAGAMFITVNTVRTHIRHILQKLDVTRRNEAVRRARELGLLPSPRVHTTTSRV